jgi:hypothetical protein
MVNHAGFAQFDRKKEAGANLSPKTVEMADPQL